jgi:hypothetical protein
MCTEREIEMNEAKRIRSVSFRLTDEEYGEIEKAAVAAGDESNNWCRQLLRVLPMSTQIDSTAAARRSQLVHKRGTKWHYAFCIRGVRYRGAIPEASTKFDAEKAETKIRQDVYEGRYGRPTGKKDFGKFVEEVYKPWAMENKRSFKSNDKYKLSIICESKCFKGKTFAQISRLLMEKYKKERREALLENGRTRKPSTINCELGILSKIFSLAIKYGITHSNPCRDIPWLPENNKRVHYLLDEEEPKLFAILNGRRNIYDL